MVNARIARTHRRAGERGAAVFIVVLVITMLTAIGLFAARAATLSTVASGHERQMTQTQYLTEYALSLALAELERAGSLNEVDAAVFHSRLAGSPPQCSTPSLDSAPYCFSFLPPTLDNKATEELLDPPAPGDASTPAAPGSLGHADIGWSFRVELADKTNAMTSPPGMPESPDGGPTIKYCTVTLNARGLLWPKALDAMGSQELTIARAGSQASMSAYVTLPCTAR
ncbi:hypothetical protein SOCEGT47_018260 [Sorangium cellulosum]|uniref:Type 4 fimbrial biogenesis protein PilX N-terminal domain-containing protein n=1 Tax=Sorangium cellulosum TaxID=56 RepID=A0A4P2PX12_SORCE|nr:pilus assembly PilX N-terminal domain-containing protein [Sorangium cellulosum]AUX21344.1 hypothetical protein SOCEGT47_018260 [Sorangium cellulosum]